MWYKIKSAVMRWFGDIKIYKYPMFIMFGHVAYKIKGEDVRKILDVLKPGDILLRRYDHYISGLMIPGYFTHAAIYVGYGNVIHLLGGGACKEDILTFTRCDDLAILRHNDRALVVEAVRLAWEQLETNVEYDFDFDTDNPEKFYCTEFVDFCYGYLVKNKIKRSYITPDDFLKSEFGIMWSNKSKQ